MRRAVQSLLHARHLSIAATSTPKRTPTAPTMPLLPCICAGCRRHLTSTTTTKRNTTTSTQTVASRKRHLVKDLELVLRHHPTEDSSAPPPSGASTAVYIDDSTLPSLPDLTKKTAAAYSRLLEEADVSNPSRHSLLVDHGRFKANWTLWRSILLFRKRLHHDEGVREVWRGLRVRRIDLPTMGNDADILWGTFVATGLRDEGFLDEIVECAHELAERSNGARVWLSLYDAIMAYVLSFRSGDALAWHWRLFPVFTSKDWGQLFSGLEEGMGSHGHHCARKIHMTLADPRVYAAVVGGLCERSMFTEAARWSRHLLWKEDLPTDSSAADALVRWTARTGTYRDLQSLFWSFRAAGVVVVESTVVAAVTSRLQTQEAVEIVLDPRASVPTAALSDSFWSSLFTSKTLKLSTIFEFALSRPRGCVVGQATVATAIAAMQLSNEKEAVEIFHLAGFTVISSPSSIPPSPLPPRSDKHNQTLHHLLNTQQIRSALYHLESMRAAEIPITRSALIHLTISLLRPRKPGKNPTTQPHLFPPGKDIDAVLTLLLSLHRGGTPIPRGLWSELLKRLGKAHRFKELERLLFTLAAEYNTDDDAPHGRGSRGPFKQLFSSRLVAALIEWGLIARPDGDGMWGVKTVRRLKEQMGIHVDSRAVVRAIRVRARELQLDRCRAKALLSAVREAWGEDVGDIEVLLRDVWEDKWVLRQEQMERMERERREREGWFEQGGGEEGQRVGQDGQDGRRSEEEEQEEKAREAAAEVRERGMAWAAAVKEQEKMLIEEARTRGML